MKAIVPAAGQGTRLYPQTHTTPKPMVRLAGKPVLGHVLDSLVSADITDLVVVVGSMKDQIIEYVSESYGQFNVTFVEQKTPEGLGHAVYQTADVAYGDNLFIALGDMLFENSYQEHLATHRSDNNVDGSIGIKLVDEPEHYGIITLDKNDRVADLEEKPENPKSDLAMSGAYIIDNSAVMFDALEHLVENNIRGSGDEYQLTDALDRMVQSGATFKTFDVGEWHDCGRPETLLEANRAMLADGGNSGGKKKKSVLVPPVDIGDGVTLTDSVIGPNVSVDDNTAIRHSIISDSIIGERSELADVNLTKSIVGANTSVRGQSKQLNVGDFSDIDL